MRSPRRGRGARCAPCSRPCGGDGPRRGCSTAPGALDVVQERQGLGLLAEGGGGNLDAERAGWMTSAMATAQPEELAAPEPPARPGPEVSTQGRGASRTWGSPSSNRRHREPTTISARQLGGEFEPASRQPRSLLLVQQLLDSAQRAAQCLRVGAGAAQ
jgi:hypothetical protein